MTDVPPGRTERPAIDWNADDFLDAFESEAIGSRQLDLDFSSRNQRLEPIRPHDGFVIARPTKALKQLLFATRFIQNRFRSGRFYEKYRAKMNQNTFHRSLDHEDLLDEFAEIESFGIDSKSRFKEQRHSDSTILMATSSGSKHWIIKHPILKKSLKPKI